MVPHIELKFPSVYASLTTQGKKTNKKKRDVQIGPPDGPWRQGKKFNPIG